MADFILGMDVDAEKEIIIFDVVFTNTGEIRQIREDFNWFAKRIFLYRKWAKGIFDNATIDVCVKEKKED